MEKHATLVAEASPGPKAARGDYRRAAAKPRAFLSAAAPSAWLTWLASGVTPVSAQPMAFPCSSWRVAPPIHRNGGGAAALAAAQPR
jgi:hypothetical protein